MQPYGTLPDGRVVNFHTLKSATLEVGIIDFGGRIVTLKTPDRQAKLANITLGYDTLEKYLSETAFFGALIGRYGNRIAHGRFVLNGRSYQLPKNNGENTLHGGDGFHNCLWQPHREQDSLVLNYLSRDGEQGFPGTLSSTVRYTVTNSDLRIDYRATTDMTTVVNLTSHGYFNLAGAGNASILDHQLTLHADRFTPVNESMIPTGELRAVADSPFDFREPHSIGARIDVIDEQLQYGQGYDHNWALNSSNGELALAAEVYEPTSGRVMQVLTTEPGMQLYSGNHLNGALLGTDSCRYVRRSGFCLEAQHFPDAPNQPHFASTTLEPDQVYQSTTIYRFSTKS